MQRVSYERKENTMEKDLVCGMSVDTDDSEKSEYQGKSYYFCSEDCKNKFDRQPTQFVNKEKEPAA